MYCTSLLQSLLVAASVGSVLARVQYSTTLPKYHPVRLAYSAIITQDDPSNQSNQALLDALADSGIVSITDIPEFEKLKTDMMSHLHTCFQDPSTSSSTSTHTYNDGTQRKTFSTMTVPGPGGIQPIFFANPTSSSLVLSCHNFQQSSQAFRTLVEQVTMAFAHRLTFELGTSIRAPLMTTQNHEYTFAYLEDVVAQGQHLEHFHVYQKDIGNRNITTMDHDKTATIDLHTDQGFFIAFTPGVFLSIHHNSENNNNNMSFDLQQVEEEDESSTLPSYTSRSSSAFLIQLPDGKHYSVTFQTQDHLIFMMGDGVNQYINPYLYKNKNVRSLRATPHALHLPTPLHSKIERLWYGRMILPPPGAYSPKHDMTFGEIRNKLLESTTSLQQKGIGCSSTHLDVRQLEDSVTCAANSTYCWHRCMEWMEYGISQEICDAQHLNIQCVNPRGQFYSEYVHGDYYPACSNSTTPIAPFTPLPNYPRNTTICTASEWNTFRSKKSLNGSLYDHSFDLSTKDTNAYFMWSVLPDGKTISGRLAFDGLFGFLALGLRNQNDPYLNGMLGSKVLLALPGGNFNAATGLNLSLPSSLKEYQIDNRSTAFRFWNDPKSSDLLSSTSSASIEKTNCFTAFTFTTESISGQKLNVSGSDSLIWAANGEDIFVSYHGMNRGRFAVEWKTGSASVGNTVVVTKTSSSASRDYSIKCILTMMSALMIALI